MINAFFEYFTGFLQLCSIRVKSIKTVDCDTLLTYSTFFLSCSSSISTNIKGAKCANIGGSKFGNIYAKDSCFKNTSTEGVYIISTYA